MDGVDADSIVVCVRDAEVRLDEVGYSVEPVSQVGVTAAGNRKRQVESIVERINRYNVANRKLWRAAVTDVSLLDYGTKKRVVGIADGASGIADGASSLGIEYYGGGIFEMGSHADMARSKGAGRRLRDAASSPYVDHFDWRDRHGKNWITSVKHQGNSGYCVAFASVGVVEALVNLYFNDTINLDLSEQEVAVCNGRNNVYTTGMYAIEAIDFLRYTGVCDEISYPFADSANVICRSDEITPIENVKISGYHYYTQSDDNIKSNIISKGPQLGGIGWFDTWEEYNQHAMALVGYNTLHAGDTIRILTRYLEDYVVIDESDPRIGSTYWMYKNSYGVNGPDMPENQGYCYVIFNNTQRQIGNISFSLPIIRAGHTDAEIICEDRDGDGIYNWGIGPKPATCPNQTQMKGDGDDSDPLLGEINTFGYCENLNPDERDTIFVTIDSVTTDSCHIYNHVVVCNGATWTVNHNQTFHNGAKVFVREGAHLDMSNSAAMRNADVRMVSGTQMLMNDNSFYKRKNGKAFNVPSGAKFILNKGKIK